MKKQIIRVLIVVLCCCFVFVAQVDAASVEFNTVDDFYCMFKNSNLVVNTTSSASGVNYPFSLATFDAEYNGELYSFPALYNNGGVAGYRVTFQYLNFEAVEGDTVNFSLVFVPLTRLNITNYDFDYMVANFYFDFGFSPNISDFTFSSSSEVISFDLVMGDISRTVDAIKIDVSFVLPVANYYYLQFGFTNGTSAGYQKTAQSFALGMFSPYVSTGLTDEEKTLLQMIMLGVDNANYKLDEMQAEQSSYYDDMITPNESNQSAVESMESARQEGQVVVDEYSSLNASLEKPNVNELLPDYDRVVDGYVDTSIFDVFSTLYESGYIMFMLLLVVFFGVMSYALFGKKA